MLAFIESAKHAIFGTFQLIVYIAFPLCLYRFAIIGTIGFGITGIKRGSCLEIYCQFNQLNSTHAIFTNYYIYALDLHHAFDSFSGPSHLQLLKEACRSTAYPATQ